MKFLRYPGGKSKLLTFLSNYLPLSTEIKGKYIEPFVGGGSVFFYIRPAKALLADLNEELIQLYKGIRNNPQKVWQTFQAFPSGKQSYYQIRDEDPKQKSLSYRAARILYLNRTCFKGMWRHNASGNFNVGYGGEARRWVVTQESLLQVSAALKKAKIMHADFEDILDNVSGGDFLFLDPPYKPGEMNLIEAHYVNGTFTFEDHQRLARKLIQVTNDKQIRWLMTNSSHPEICELYRDFNIMSIPKGTSSTIGVYTEDAQEILISSCQL
jgi:DNA adenine methylase